MENVSLTQIIKPGTHVPTQAINQGQAEHHHAQAAIIIEEEDIIDINE
jgi:hypothetical protein